MSGGLLDSLPSRVTWRSDATRTRLVRHASIAALIVFLWTWHVRSTGAVQPVALLFLASLPVICLAFGRLFVDATARVLTCRAGIAYELLAGFFCANTLLFVLTLLSPLGMATHFGLLVVVALACIVVPRRRSIDAAGLDGEFGSLACLVFAGFAATLWLRDVQPIAADDGPSTVYRVWSDMFIHGREISAFAQAHGLASLSDIKLAGVPAPIYHFSSYMFSAALHALTPTSAIDCYAALMLPFGIVLSGMAAYVLVSSVTKATWPAVIACVAVLAAPDAYQQGVGIRYLSYQFMTQVNLTMLYGLACISIAWIFMLDACRRGRLAGVVIAYAFLALCVAYKAHLFVANALLMMIYPCIFFARENRRLRWWMRGLAAAGLVAIYWVAVSLSQLSPRVPTLRFDGSGIGGYVQILLGGFADGWFRRAFVAIYSRPHLPFVLNGLLDGVLVVIGSYGIWVVLAPLVYRMTRRQTAPRAWSFVLLVSINYLAMTLLLSLDKHPTSTPEEFSNRPQAWAYFVLVAFVSAGIAQWMVRTLDLRRARVRWLIGALSGLGLMSVYVHARDLQTFPEWGQGDYADFNRVANCQVHAAQYVRDHARIDDVLQDSEFDPRFMTTAIAERQAYVVGSSFAGNPQLVAARIDGLKALQASRDSQALVDWARVNRVSWYLMHPADASGRDASFLAHAAFRCGDYRVFRF